jgi:hypothetical protein
LLRRLAAVFVALLVVWAGLRFLRSRRDTPEGFASPRFDRAAVDTIRLRRGDTTVRLARDGQSWRVNDFAAAPTSVTELLDALTDTAATSELVAQSASSHTRMGVDSAAARHLEIKSGGTTLATYILGNRGAGWSGIYVRRPGSDAVYLLRGRVGELVDRTVDDWRDKRIAALEPDSIAELEVTRGKTSYLLRRQGTGWTLGDGNATDSAAVASLLDRFRSLAAAGFATPAQADSADFTRPERRVRLAAADGRPLLVLVIDSSGYNYWARKDTSSTVYRLDSWVVNQLTPADSTLKTKGGPADR